MNKPMPNAAWKAIVTGEELPPRIEDDAAWAEVMKGPLGGYRPEALVLVLDAKLEASRQADDGRASLDGVAGAILVHLDELARSWLDGFIPWFVQNRDAAIDDIAGVVMDGLISRERRIRSLRTNFVGAVYAARRHHWQEKARKAGRWAKLQERGPSTKWLMESIGTHDTDAFDGLAAMAAREHLSGIRDPRHRFAVWMHLMRYKRHEIATVVGVRDPETVTKWLTRHLGEDNL